MSARAFVRLGACQLRKIKINNKLDTYLIKYYYIVAIWALGTTRSSIPCYWSVMISVPATRQRRHLTRFPEVINATISQECIAKNASGVAMRMNKPYSKTPQLGDFLTDHFLCFQRPKCRAAMGGYLRRTRPSSAHSEAVSAS